MRGTTTAPDAIPIRAEVERTINGVRYDTMGSPRVWMP